MEAEPDKKHEKQLVTRYWAWIGGKEISAGIDSAGRLSLDEEETQPHIRRIGKNSFVVLIGGRAVTVIVHADNGRYAALVNGKRVEMTAASEREKRLREFSSESRDISGLKEIRAPMPALVVSVGVRSGQTVSKGQGVVVLEAMKMENEIKAHQEGTVDEVLVTAGSAVEKGALLIKLK